MVKLRIHLQSGAAAFLAGEQVSGEVIAQVDEPTKARRMCLEVFGHAFNRWHERHGKSTYIYKAEVQFINVIVLLWKPPSGDVGVLASGDYCFPFSFVIPPNALPNHRSWYGTIDYWCKAKVDRPWHTDDIFVFPFYVARIVDLNTMDRAANPVRCNVQKELGCFGGSGVLSVQASLDKFGYTGGEQMVLSLDINNESNERVTAVNVRLTEAWNYQAACASLFGPQVHSRCFSRDLLSFAEAFDVPPREADCYERRIRLPNLQPSYGCQITSHIFYISIHVSTSGSCSSSLGGQLPFYVGTIPIGGPRAISPSGSVPVITTEARKEAIRNVVMDETVDTRCC
ncbi:Protein ARRD-7 [Aphelenchoides avenae]|nr:Protein ARRD-7 [Aphelenchus avenae]